MSENDNKNNDNNFLPHIINVVAFFGFGCNTVDFGPPPSTSAAITSHDEETGGEHHQHLNHPSRVRCCCCLDSPQFWFWFEKILLVLDLLNFVLDIYLINKLLHLNDDTEESYQDEDDDDKGNNNVWATQAAVLLCVNTVTTFIGTMFIGKAILYHVKHFQPPQDTIVYKHSVYYGYWCLMELSAFLLENATTIYIYVSSLWEDNDDIRVDNHDKLNGVLDATNLVASIISGLLSFLAVFLMICSVYSNNGHKIKTNFVCKLIIAGILVIYPAYLAISRLVIVAEEVEEANDDDDDLHIMEEERHDYHLPQKLALGVSNLLGYCFFAYLLLCLCSHKFCGDTSIEWPTDHGKLLQWDLLNTPTSVVGETPATTRNVGDLGKTSSIP